MDVSLFTKYQNPVRTNETKWGELVKEFMEPININRVSNKYKPYSFERMAKELAPFKEKDNYNKLYALLSICKDAGKRDTNYHRGFSKKFFWELKSK